MDRRDKYDITEDPDFEDGEVVEVDTSWFGLDMDKAEYVEGVVVGKQMSGWMVNWIIDFGDRQWYEGAKYRCFVMPTCAICRKDK